MRTQAIRTDRACAARIDVRSLEFRTAPCGSIESDFLGVGVGPYHEIR